MKHGPTSDGTSHDFLVVGIGASAGGIPALQTLFSSLPPVSDLAFVVVQHTSRDRASGLAELFGRCSALPVLEAVEGMRVEPGHVYVAPSARALLLEDGAFTTAPLDGGERRPGIDTIDRFFESLALAAGPRAIAVVLSGGGTDGAAGCVRIRQAGGMVLVQDPSSAMHVGMPTAAIASGAADRVLPVDALARELVASASPSYERSGSATWAGDVTRAVDGIVHLIRTTAGVDLTPYKTAPLLWRIQHRMEARRVRQFSDYETLLRDEPSELEALIRDLPIHLTAFFRDAGAWEALERHVIPELFEHAGEGPVRTWTPACATGEEAYSLAMLLAEHAGTRQESADFQVFATDASSQIVARASHGLFPPDALETLSPERRRRFFHSADGAFRVKHALREKIVFARHDLLSDPPFSGMDLVTCRNLLVYLRREAAERVVHRLHSSLRPGGYLVLGSAESLHSPQGYGFEELPEELSLDTRIYRKTAASPPVGFGSSPRAAPRRESTSGREARRSKDVELQASREELRALNEELRTSHEQLNVTSDELSELKAELSGRVRELDTQGDVLSSGAVMTLFLDDDLNIRWYTPGVGELFPLKPGDVGRPITDLVAKFPADSFVADARSVLRIGELHEDEVRTRDGRWYLQRIRPFLSSSTMGGEGVAITFTDITDRKGAETALRESESALQSSELILRRDQTWLAAQNAAFRSAIDGEPLATSLGVLVRAIVEHSEVACRCAFYVVDSSGSGLRHVVGMPDSYAERVDGLEISPESLACGLAVATGAPVVTPDVLEEPRWEPWIGLARDYGYRGCWSFPVETSSGRLVGSMALYFEQPRSLAARDLERVAAFTQTAATIIARHEREELSRAELEARRSGAWSAEG